MPHDAYKALYVHIPFCVKRCLYCDFTTQAMSSESKQIDEYIEDICLQIRRLSKEGELSEIETIYIGGGTPSFIGNKRLSMLLYTISTSMNLEKVKEFSMEANPESIDERLINDIWALGVNRLSIGVQSFSDEILNVLGRAHSADDAKDAIRTSCGRFDNISIDLMCGIPGQTEDNLRQSLKTAIELGIPHISVYPLTIEPHTPFANMVRAGQLEEPEDDIQAAHMELVCDILEQAGYHRYEVASYAKAGYECKHNISYWSGVPYKGVGVSAATMTQNSERRMREQDGHITDDLNAAEMAAEDLMLGMRMASGISREKIESAAVLLPKLPKTIEKLEQKGLVVMEGGSMKPTNLGWLCGNEIYGALLELSM